MGTKSEHPREDSNIVRTGAELARLAELDRELAGQLVARARAEGVNLVGENGLLKGLVKLVLEGALEAEMSEHLGYEKGDSAGVGSGNSRNGTSKKTVLTDVGPVDLQVPRDRAGSFVPAIVPKHSRRVQGFDAAILSLYAKGLTTGEIQAHLSEIYDVEVSRDLISRATHQVSSELEAWRNRPLDRVYAVVMIDAIVVKVRDGAVANRPVYVAVGINLEGERDVLGMWVGKGGEGAKTWMTWLTELRNRGVEDVLIACCDGLKGLPESIQNTWPQADVQLCVVHMVRASLKYASTKYWAQIAKELRHVYTAANADAAEARFSEFEAEWGTRYPALIGVWRRNWEHFVMFLRFPPEIRKIVYTTNMIESLNARFRQATRRRGHFPDEDSALKVLYLVIRDRQPNRPNVTGRTRNWKEAINTLAGFYGDRVLENQ
ncbi:IS256 family transposase [Streptomyces sp. NBC_00365]|uniref:IS256 family transposase n=1 Tax=Streptomyces sp. NBC_00365 TaxID=2975726 RepID=UPI00225AB8EB|nr:IS256 family transposase [Streptomyces sp. NBC_00365]MCX5093828.1 IS256 family transposase [Streptomyces sp. NBC_00365]MCX5095796.1 IS256 family transposase [Streptomyces sp. NBC_00365]